MKIVDELSNFFNASAGAATGVQQSITNINQAGSELKKEFDEAKTAVTAYAAANLALNAISTACAVGMLYLAWKKSKGNRS